MADLGDEQDSAEQLDSDVVDDDVDDAEGALQYPPDRPLGVEDYGTIASEERVDEPLADRVRREIPDGLGALDGPDDAELVAIELADDDLDDVLDLDEPVDTRPFGRLVEPGADDDGVDYVDEEPDAVASEVDESDLSAEEEAVHLTAEPPYRSGGYDDDR